MAVAERVLLRIRRLQSSAQFRGESGNECSLKVAGLDAAGGVEPLEHLLNDRGCRKAGGRVRGRAISVEVRSAIVEVDRTRLTAGGDGIVDAVVDLGDVLRVVRRE